jgi:uncharacterized membrane protein YqhA
MVASLLRLRWIAVVVALSCALESLALVAVGVIRGFEGYRSLFAGPPYVGEISPGVFFAKSLDAFLVAMVFFVFSIGMTTLFLVRPGTHALELIPEWMRVKSLSELKFVLWEAILVTLVVATVESLVVNAQDLAWTALILPITILILALGLYLSRKAH